MQKYVANDKNVRFEMYRKLTPQLMYMEIILGLKAWTELH